MGFAALLVCIAGLLSVPGVAAGAQYDIGPGHGYERPADFPWDNLGPGDVVRIHWRREPYREKLVLRRSGAKDRPIVIRGIPGPSKELPVIEGAGAVQFQEMQSPRKAGRGLIIIGDREPANHIVIERLEIRGANNTEKFVWGNATIPYENNAAGVFVDKGTGITVRQCSIHSCCMGVITAYYPDVGDFVLHGNHIHNNGDFTGERWGHNVYLCANRTWVQFNRFGEMRSDGNNIKDRSGRTIIRYNWIEGGLSRQIDMVESNRYPRADALRWGTQTAV